MSGLVGRVAMVTGAAGGLGRAFCDTLLKSGSKVCITDCNKEHGEHVTGKLAEQYGRSNVTFRECDVTSRVELEDCMKHTVSTFGGMDILINNAGIMDESQHAKMVSINLGAVIEGTFLGQKYMGKDQGGRGGVIVNMSSAAGVCPISFGAAYAGTKYGVVGFTLSMGFFAKRKENGVRVNCLCPTFADTDILHLKHEHMVSNKAQYEKTFKKVEVMQPSQVAEAIMPLIEKDNLNGAIMLCDKTGHRLLKLPLIIEQIPSV